MANQPSEEPVCVAATGVAAPLPVGVAPADEGWEAAPGLLLPLDELER